jgi:hypothetical protein
VDVKLGLLGAVGCALLAGCASSGASAPPPPESLAVFAAGERLGTVTESNLHRFRVPARLHLRHGRARLVVEISRTRSRREIRRAFGHRRRRLDLRVTPVSSSVAVRPVLQVLHNDCEVDQPPSGWIGSTR